MDSSACQILLGFDISSHKAHMKEARQLRLRVSHISVSPEQLSPPPPTSSRGRLADLLTCKS